MTPVAYNADDHLETLVEWWEIHHGVGNRIDPEILSPLGGVVIDGAGLPIMAGFVFIAHGCRLAFIELLVARPGNHPRTSRAAGKILFEFLRNQAVMWGAKVAYAHAEDERMIPEMERVGFQVESTGALLRKDLQS